MRVVGLTGGIASGKSTVASHWRERGVPVIDADHVARDVVEPGTPALAAIAAHFGSDMLTADGRLDRGKLGALVFADSEQLAMLNDITHPAILEAVAQRIEELRVQGHPWIAYEAALIVENGLAPALSQLVVVVAEPERQHSRLMARNNLDAEQAWNRIRSQASNAERTAAADIVINNNGSLAVLLDAADAFVDSAHAHVSPKP